MYLASRLHKEISKSLPKSLIGQELSYPALSKLLNKCVRFSGAKIRVQKDAEFSKKKRQYFTFSGYYDTEKKNSIVVTLHVMPDREHFKITRSNYDTLVFLFSQVIQHEFIHKSQFTFRPDQVERKIKVFHSDKISKKKLEQIEYLREWCEVEAYAHDIAMEINYFYPNDNPNTVIKNIDSKRKLDSYQLYKKTFARTNWDRLKKSLLRKIWKWLPSAHVPVSC
jgi:hypothetical protein